MFKSRLLTFVIKELREVLPPTVFFAISFNLLVLTTQLILADYMVHLGSFMLATTTALVVGKSVLVANAMPFLRRFDTAPMIQPVLFKTMVYWAVVFLVRFLERLVEYLFAGGTLSRIPEYVAAHFTWHRFAAIQIWIFVLFLIYTSVEELNARLGDRELMKIFFTRRSSGMKRRPPTAHSRAPQTQPANRGNTPSMTHTSTKTEAEHTFPGACVPGLRARPIRKEENHRTESTACGRLGPLAPI